MRVFKDHQTSYFYFALGSALLIGASGLFSSPVGAEEGSVSVTLERALGHMATGPLPSGFLFRGASDGVSGSGSLITLSVPSLGTPFSLEVQRATLSSGSRFGFQGAPGGAFDAGALSTELRWRRDTIGVSYALKNHQRNGGALGVGLLAGREEIRLTNRLGVGLFGAEDSLSRSVYSASVMLNASRQITTLGGWSLDLSAQAQLPVIGSTFLEAPLFSYGLSAGYELTSPSPASLRPGYLANQRVSLVPYLRLSRAAVSGSSVDETPDGILTYATDGYLPWRSIRSGVEIVGLGARGDRYLGFGAVVRSARTQTGRLDDWLGSGLSGQVSASSEFRGLELTGGLTGLIDDHGPVRLRAGWGLELSRLRTSSVRVRGGESRRGESSRTVVVPSLTAGLYVDLLSDQESIVRLGLDLSRLDGRPLGTDVRAWDGALTIQASHVF
jgi:hypothetical protein